MNPRFKSIFLTLALCLGILPSARAESFWNMLTRSAIPLVQIGAGFSVIALGANLKAQSKEEKKLLWTLEMSYENNPAGANPHSSRTSLRLKINLLPLICGLLLIKNGLEKINT